MSIKYKYIAELKTIKTIDCKDWLLKKTLERAKKNDILATYSFGLYENIKLVGVCTFGNAIPMQVVKKSICGEKEYGFSLCS